MVCVLNRWYLHRYDLVNINRCHLHSTLHSTVLHRLLIAVARPVLPLWLLHQSAHHPPPTLITNRGTFRQVGRMGLIIIVNQLMTDRPRDTVFSCLVFSCLSSAIIFCSARLLGIRNTRRWPPGQVVTQTQSFWVTVWFLITRHYNRIHHFG